MRRVIQGKSGGRRRSAFFLWLLLAVLVISAAVPVYGIIRDMGPGEAVFVLPSPLSSGAEEEQPAPGLLDRIHGFLFPSSRIDVPAARRIDLEGRVLYSNGAPYAGGAIRLESEPRYARTDENGYFVFYDVEEGRHVISALDESGAVLAQSVCVIERAFERTDVTLLRLSDGTFVFQVAVDVRVLEITITLSLGEDGSVAGIEDIVLGLSPEPEPSVSPEVPLPTDTPVPSATPVPSPGGSDGGGSDGGGSSPGSPAGPGVYDPQTAYATAGAAAVNIFGADKRLAPGMKGSYRFTVDNTGNDSSVRYSLTFLAADSLPEGHKIPMRFRLKAGGVFVAGGESVWREASELAQDAVLGAGRAVTYTLDWYWPESEHDNDFAAFAGYSYGLTIKVAVQG